MIRIAANERAAVSRIRAFSRLFFSPTRALLPTYFLQANAMINTSQFITSSKNVTEFPQSLLVVNYLMFIGMIDSH